MNITLRQFEVLVQVAETGSFTLAAEQLGVSQPSVSDTVRRIETELGFAVFHRTTRRLTVSHDGAHVISSARELIRTMRFTQDAILSRMGGESSQIALAALPSLIGSLLAPALRSFRQQHPGVMVNVHDSNQERALTLVSEGVADMAFVSQGALRHDLKFEALAADRFFLLCAEGHRLARRAQVRWADLSEERFIALGPTSSVRKATDAAFLQANAQCVPYFELEQVPSVAALAQAQLGVAALPEFSFAMFRHDDLVMVPLVEPEMDRRIGVVTRRNRPPSPSVRAFLDHCRRSLSTV